MKISLKHLVISGVLATSFIHSSNVFSQISEGGLPPSFNFQNQLRSESAVTEIPVNFNVEDLKMVDEWQVSQGKPLRIATHIPTHIDINSHGHWLTLPDGTKIWQLRIHAKDAIALTLYYSDFHIPQGGKLFIYNQNRTQVLGAYTGRTNPSTKEYATQFVAGDDITLEYVAAPSNEMPRLVIDEIGYGYNHLSVVNASSDYLKATPLSGPCMVNINCEEGEEWQEQKKGVCKMIMKKGRSTYLCTGSLINNTAQDKKPYILSASHCYEINDKEVASDQDLNRWMFVFNDEHTGCSNETGVIKSDVLIGCSQKVYSPTNGGSDALLLLLNHPIPDSLDVVYNGWDRTERPATSGVSIHHPSGDHKKISTYGERGVTSYTWREPGETGGLKNAHWDVIFDQTDNGHAVTEGGSSGSPLFNQDGLIVGTLTGGSSTCDIVNGSNLYGKMAYHWDKYGSDKKGQLKEWLDPLQRGTIRLAPLTTDGKSIPFLKSPRDLTINKTVKGYELNWEAPLFTQTLSWAYSPSYTLISYDGDPFYFGQKWTADELKPVDRKTITDVSFVPISSVEYEIYIKQGLRKYRQEIPSYEPNMINTFHLRTPFVIDCTHDLVVSIHAKKYASSSFPALIDQGPVLKKKGNLVSFDGEKWEEIEIENLESKNVIMSVTVSSEEGKPIVTPRSSQGNCIVLHESTTKAAVKKISTPIEVQEQSGKPEKFPEVTGYNVYREATKLRFLPFSQTQFIDRNPLATTAQYAVSAQFGKEEGKRKMIKSEEAVQIEQVENSHSVQLTPTLFTQQVRLSNHEQVCLLEVYSIHGKLMMRVNKPEEIIHTTALPQGMYVFLLYTNEGPITFEGIRE